MGLGYDTDDDALVYYNNGPCLNKLSECPDCDMNEYTVVISHGSTSTDWPIYGTFVLSKNPARPTTWFYETWVDVNGNQRKLIYTIRGQENLNYDPHWYVDIFSDKLTPNPGHPGLFSFLKLGGSRCCPFNGSYTQTYDKTTATATVSH